MKAEERENLYGLLRDSGDVLGTSRATMVALGAMIDVIKSLKCSEENVGELYQEFVDVVKSSQPKIVPLLQLIREFERESKAYLNADLQDRRKQAVGILEKKLKSYRGGIKGLIENGAQLVQDGEMIVVHMASYMVTNLLIKAKLDLKRNFKVIILQQLVVRSKQAINALTDVGIEHIIAPAHDLGHYLESSNKLLAAAATITKDRKVMAAAGTANIVNSCNLHGIPTYLLAPSYHFFKGTCDELNIHEASETICDEDCQYDLRSYSHDLLDVDRFDFFINEQGIMEREEFMAQYMGDGHVEQGKRRAVAP